jgi:hypothetical protein
LFAFSYHENDCIDPYVPLYSLKGVQYMRMTRDSYAREVWKVVEAIHQGHETTACPHENCEEQLEVLVASLRAGTTIVCPQHGVIFRE